MTDRRATPANDHVAKRTMENPPEGVTLVDGEMQQIARSVGDLFDAPGGCRERQLLRGEEVLTLDTRDGFAFVEAKSGYVGYVAEASLKSPLAATHFVSTPTTHAYTDENMKSREVFSLCFGARVRVLDERHKFFETDVGYVPKSHLRSLDRPLTDPVAAAQLFFGVPYLWGGNSSRGIDCSGLISAGFGACDFIVPGDSDQQCNTFGEHRRAGATPQRGDLIFWEGHVGLMVNEEVMLHANAHHMACRYEPLEQAKLRIKAQGDGEMTAHKCVT